MYKYLLIFLLLGQTSVFAERLLVGFKGWLGFWQPAVQTKFQGTRQNILKDAGVSGDLNFNPGFGYLGGPTVGIQSQDGKWSLGFAYMLFSNFDSTTSTSFQYNTLSGSTLEWQEQINFSAERSDLDLSIAYSINNQIRFYLGYKQQKFRYKMDLLNSYPEAASQNFLINKDIELSVGMPTVGFGYSYMLAERLVLGSQLGLIYSLPKLEKWDEKGTNQFGVYEVSYKDNFDITSEAGFGLTAEVTVTYLVSPALLAQFGLRSQYLPVDLNMSKNQEQMAVVMYPWLENTPDIFYGLTFSMVYFLEI